ncbi:DUF475 domain-containing protein [Candidatus Dactylopiibacterium carminicum]|uniref:DUF475 domain-containing protein n=1 Tax=Candidatus Dactylopiibacterium carminicum TaxID=857335 RepID=UPI001482F1DA|nr:DUF475 domain-containing protein [Candidatus Dactylopiibacterium carminicum]
MSARIRPPIMLLKYFGSSLLFSAVCLILAVVAGAFYGGPVTALAYFISCLTLGILETAVSLDNAVVNAKYLQHMNERSRRWFITWGMVIAVFGMRLVFPVLIVCLAAWTDPVSAVRMALFQPDEYAYHMEESHHEVMAFGAAFLLMVAIDFFFDPRKKIHWIPGLEHIAALIGRFPQAEVLIATPLILLAALLAPTENREILLSGFGGMLSFYLVHGVKDLLEELDEGMKQAVPDAGRLMVGSLLFLEVLDASFSFDGVVSAFAITNNFILIALGLGIGAMFVRSMTIYLVDRNTMSKLRFIEHGAFFGIAWLVAAMTLSLYGVALGEVIVAGVAATIIVISVIHSLFHRSQVEG